MNRASLVICDNAATVKRLRDYSGRRVDPSNAECRASRSCGRGYVSSQV